MTTLYQQIVNKIRATGPITVEEYISLALYTPDNGYYAKDHIIGRAGDFITSPEVTQIFGELIGIFIIDQFTSAESIEYLDIIECGPGRGTLMADIMNTLQSYTDIYNKTRVHLVEISNNAKAHQQKALAEHHNIHWYTTLEAVPQSTGYTFFLANEFFDALPIKQFYRIEDIVYERMVTLNHEGNLTFDIADDSAAIEEICPSYKMLMNTINTRLMQGQGSVLIIDYGDDTKNRTKNTLQGVRCHQLVNIFDEPGSVDISHQVNFGALRDLLSPKMIAYPLITQTEFLYQLGIDLRLKQLLNCANAQQRMELLSACARLTSPQYMGEIFKVFYATSRQ